MLAYPPAIADPPAFFFQRIPRVARDAPQLRRLVFGFACPEIGGYSQKPERSLCWQRFAFNVRTQKNRAGSLCHHKFKLGLCALPLLQPRP